MADFALAQDVPPRITAEEVARYHRDGYLVVPDLLDAAELARLHEVTADLVAAAAEVETHTDIYDLEPSHTRAAPRVRRIKAPHKLHPAFDAVVRKPVVMSVLHALLGPGLRLHGSKLNMKSAQYGSPVEWHQDWAFYPHTNDDILAIGVMLDDISPENGPMLVVPGTHRGPLWNHHGEDGRFCGAIDPAEITAEIDRAVPTMGPAGTMSFHHVRTLHGSATNTSNRPRNLLLFEVAASDAWPLVNWKGLEEFDSRLLAGPSTITPRLAPVPVRMPYPPALHQGSIYENQTGTRRTYFARAAE
jgi:ectoine hydroxylase-related dioxygenase (phytanoyl-CoA dioxygenase family)